MAKGTVEVIGHTFIPKNRIACVYGIQPDEAIDRKVAVIRRTVGERFLIRDTPCPADEKARREQEIKKPPYNKRWSEEQKDYYLKFLDFMPEGMRPVGVKVAAKSAQTAEEGEEGGDQETGTDEKPITLDALSVKDALELVDKETDKSVLTSWFEAEKAEKKRKPILNALKAKLPNQ